VRKEVGAVAEAVEKNGLPLTAGTLGIAHTRWATHGGVSLENAHPHLSCDKAFAVVHNGIISNYQTLRSELESQGHRFSSETDTEVFPHLVEEIYRSGVSVEEAFVRALRSLEGTYAIAMISTHDPDRIFCARERSPLILGIGADTNFVASDVNAFLPYTRCAIPIEDGEYGVLAGGSYFVTGIADGKARNNAVMEINWSVKNADKNGHAHYMEKEISEQPGAIARAMQVPQKEIALLASLLREARRKILVGVGTTYYVAFFGQYLLADLAGLFAPAISSDEAGLLAVSDPGTLLVAISQSGETFDTLQALRQAKAAGARTAAIVNVPGSSMTREADLVIHQDSGPEICVISTKAAMAQIVLLIRLAVEVAFANQNGSGRQKLEILGELAYLPKLIQMTLQSRRELIRKIARSYCHKQNWFFLGRGLCTPIAFESALKMKEVTYLHAEGMSAGFLKHGTLSLIDENTPCVFLVPPAEAQRLYDLTMSSVEEVRARGGIVIGIHCGGGKGKFDGEVLLPKASPWVAPLLQLVIGQLLAYETAVALGRNVDRPRSLAKSVTVS
jgi:glucosamine--fructose-6-phosphate aminotransferase (isomerizing)